MTNYGKDYPSYGKIKAKLVMKRPEEKYYPLNFACIPQSKYSLENKKTPSQDLRFPIIFRMIIVKSPSLPKFLLVQL